MTAVFSAEYAASLVERARDGATFSEVTRDSWARVADHDVGSWLPSAWYVRNDYRHQHPGTHWVEWYRETSMACHLAAWICTGTAREYGTVRDGSWDRARVDLDAIGGEFYRSMRTLGSLCQLPAEWTAEHRVAARGVANG